MSVEIEIEYCFENVYCVDVGDFVGVFGDFEGNLYV